MANSFAVGRRALLGFLPVLLLVGCANSQPGASSIPFTEAFVAPADHAVTVSWAAPQAHAVRVYAGTDPAHVGRDHPVGQGGGSGSVSVAALAPDARWYFELVPDSGHPLVVAERSLHLPTAPNFRDAGGYRTADGHWVRMGLLYRSDQLDLLSAPDLETVHKAGVHLFCDLRTDAERKRGPDKLPEGGLALIADVAGDDGATSHLTGLFTDKAVQQEVRLNGGSAKLMIDANRQFVNSPSALKAYKAVFERLADPKALPGLFHCTAGKDRTGWAEAVFLSIMGVPRDVIMQDYLMSNAYLDAKNKRLIAFLKGKADPALLQPLLDVRAEYLQAAFDEADARYGSFDRYVREGLGLDEPTIQALRHEFLAG